MLILKTEREALLGPLERVAGLVERRQTLPILGHVLIRKTGQGIELTTSDLELQLHQRCEIAAGGGELATTVSARKLLDILRALPVGQALALSTSRDKLVLQAGRSRFSLQTLPADDFPLAAQPADLSAPLLLPRTVLRSLLEQVAFAMAVHDLRYFLNGVLMVIEPGQLTLVATDGNRLACAEAAVPLDGPAREAILPRKTVHELLRLMRQRAAESDGAEAQVSLRLGTTQASFAFDRMVLSSKLVEGRFPDYRRVIPTNLPKSVVFDREQVLAGLQRAAIVSDEKFKGVMLQLAPGLLRIVSSNSAQEEGHEEFEVDYAGEPVEMGINVNYLTELLASGSTPMVQMALQDARSSALFSFPEREGFRYVVSPMRL